MNKIKIFFFYFLFSLSMKAEEIYASFDVYALHQSKLSFELSGIVKAIKIAPSDLVKKGEVLIELENSTELIALQSAQNELALAQIAFENIQAKMYKFKQVQELIDAQSFEDMQTQFTQSELKLKQAALNVEHFQNILEKKKLKAPFDARIGAVFVELGEAVFAVSEPVLELFSYPEVKLLLSFDEKYKDKVKAGQLFRFEIDGKKFEAHIVLVYPNIDIKTRKIFAEVRMQALMPGLFGQGVIIAE